MTADRLVEWWEETELLAEPADLHAHLLTAHAMPAAVLAAHEPAEWKTWHLAEHRTRHPKKGAALHAGHLRHTHPQWLPKSATEKAA